MIDLFVDLSAWDPDGSGQRSSVPAWLRPERLDHAVRRLTAIGTAPHASPVTAWPDHWKRDEPERRLASLGAALAGAGRHDVPLLLVLGRVEITDELLGSLQLALAQDPMFGFAVPRIACANGCCFVRLSGHGIGATEFLPRRVLAELPDHEILVEVASPCMLIAPEVLGNFGPLDAAFDSIPGAMLQYMASARRCGFRTTLCNRTVASVEGLTCGDRPTPPLARVSDSDRLLLRDRVHGFERGWQEFRGHSWERFEQLCTVSASRRSAASRRSLLLDIRNVGPIYNGTTQAVLGLVNAMKALEPEWDVALLANPHGAAFHNYDRIYAGWPVYTAVPDRPFTVTLRPSQPWHIQEMIDLHNVSLFNAYVVLDTIAWDVTYCAPTNLEGIWQFMADHSDGLLFDSRFTERRFLERFPTGRTVPGLVTHLSFDLDEYVRPEATRTKPGGYVLVIGNNLDHKDVGPTVDMLASAFPFKEIVALGPAPKGSPLVNARHSGNLPELEVHRLYAGAEFVVFPSFYEGFGFPILTALAYGRTVLARRSALVDELAARCRPNGRLIVFDRREQMVAIMGRILHGETVPSQPLGLSLNGSTPRSWGDVARDTLGFLDTITAEPSRSRWIARERVTRQMVAFTS
jgi:glycosyltransferase involved in cell wall biosynthesis